MTDQAMTLLPAGAIIVLVGIGLLLFLSRKSGKRRLNTSWYQERWKGIEQQFNDGTAGQSLAVINADKLVDKAMQELSFAGQTMGERLKKRPGAFGDINAVWRAHKLRNKISHDQSQVYEAECRQALSDLKRGLKNLGALQ